LKCLKADITEIVVYCDLFWALLTGQYHSMVHLNGRIMGTSLASTSVVWSPE